MKVVILSGACKSGKSYLLKKVKKDLRDSAVTIYDMDALEYWTGEAVEQELESVDVIVESLGVGKIADKMKRNIQESEPWEKIVKVQTIMLLARRQNALIINVLDRTKKDNFYKLLSEIFKVKIHFAVMIPSVCRYCINLYKRKDRKVHSQTWGMRSDMKERTEMFDVVLTNGFFWGVWKPRKRLVAFLSDDSSLL